MFGNDPQCRAQNSGRRKVCSTEGIKQPLHLVRRPGHLQFEADIIIWADIITLGGHQQLEWTSFWVDTTRGTSSSVCLDSIRGGRHVSSRVIKRVTQHLSVQVTRNLKRASVMVSVANQRAGRTSLIVRTFQTQRRQQVILFAQQLKTIARVVALYSNGIATSS